MVWAIGHGMGKRSKKRRWKAKRQRTRALWESLLIHKQDRLIEQVTNILNAEKEKSNASSSK